MADLKLASAGHDIRLWDCNGFSLVKQFNPHTSNVCSMCWSPDNSTLVSACAGGNKIALTYVNQAYNNSEIAVEDGRTCVALTSSSRYLLEGGDNGHINIWDLKTKKMRKTYKDHKAPVTYVCFNYNDSDIASGAENGNIILYNVITGQGSSPLCTSKPSAIRQLKYSKFKHSLLGSVSDDGCVNMWDTNKRCLLHSFSDHHKAPATGLAFSPINEMLVLSVGLDKRIICYDVRGYHQIKMMVAESPLTSIDIASDGGTFAVGTTRGKIYVYDLRQGATPINMMAAHKSSVQVLAFQHDTKPSRQNFQQDIGNGERHKAPAAVKRPLSAAKPIAMANHRVSNETYSKSDINANQTPPTHIDLVQETQEIFSPLREVNQRASQGEGDQSLPNKSNESNNHSVDTETIYSPLRRNTDRESSGQTPVRPWAYSASRIPQQSEPAAQQRETRGVTPGSHGDSPTPGHTEASQETESSPGSQSVGSSQDDQELGGQPTITRQSSDPARGQRRQLPSPKTATPRANNAVSVRGSERGSSPRLMLRQLSDGTDGAAGVASGGSFQMEVLRNLVEEAMDDVREELRRDILNMHVEMIRLFQIQQEEMRTMLEQYSVNGELLAQIEQLKEENKRLKQKF